MGSSVKHVHKLLRIIMSFVLVITSIVKALKVKDLMLRKLEVQVLHLLGFHQLANPHYLVS